MEDIFNFKKIFVEWQKHNHGKEKELALDTFKNKYMGSTKFGNNNLVPGTIYACTRLLLPEEKGIVNIRPLFLSLGPKKKEGDREEVVIDICLIPLHYRPLIFAMLYKYYAKKLMRIADLLAEGKKNNIPIQLSSKEASMILNRLLPNESIVSVPREALTKIHIVDLSDWPLVCFMDTKGMGSRLPHVFSEYKQALEKSN